MPYVDSSGVSIHYHVEGEGPPLVLQHGLTSSLENWYAYGFVEDLKKDYRLIMVDARGHGRSGKPHDPKDYDLRLRVNDVLSVMDATGVDKAHYMGYSMGGRIGFVPRWRRQTPAEPKSIQRGCLSNTTAGRNRAASTD